MNSANSLLILSAGRGIGLDGFHKLNLVAPSTGETILARYLRQLSAAVTVVVGYRAPEMMAQHPSLNYVYNHSWFETGSAFSAGMGLSKAPVIVVPSDLFLDEAAAKGVSTATGNVIFASSTENRPQNSVNIEMDGDTVVDIYTGPKRHGGDPEFKGIVRIEDLDLLEALVKTCEANPAAPFSDCLNLHRQSFRAVVLDGEVTEINAVAEYVEFFNRDRDRADP
jgi:hypothetical protein